MCVILDIKAGAKIPQDMLETACDINPHGFGLAFVKKGRVHLLRSSVKNDLANVSAQLEKYNQYRVFLHLRYATVGDDYDERNSHPFLALNYQDDGMDLCLMHNGTLNSYIDSKNKHLSDTYFFNLDYLSPLAQRVKAFVGAEEVLQDTFFEDCVSEKAGAFSVMLLFDNHGNTLIINGNRGKEYEWGWASNDYSFDIQHPRSSRRKTTTTSNAWSSFNHQNQVFNSRSPDYFEPAKALSRMSRGSWGDWEKEFIGETGGEVSGHPTVSEGQRINSWMTALTQKHEHERTYNPSHIVAVKRIIEKAKSEDRNKRGSIMVASGAVPQLLDVRRKPAAELLGVNSLEDLTVLRKEEIAEMCAQYPGVMAEVFVDLFAAAMTKS